MPTNQHTQTKYLIEKIYIHTTPYIIINKNLGSYRTAFIGTVITNHITDTNKIIMFDNNYTLSYSAATEKQFLNNTYTILFAVKNIKSFISTLKIHHSSIKFIISPRTKKND